MVESKDAGLRLIAEEAANWYLLFGQEREVSKAERRRFVAWLRRSPAHIEEFLRVSALRAEFASLAAAELPGIDRLIEEARSNVIPLENARPAVRSPVSGAARSKWRLGAVAASLVFLLLSLSVWLSGAFDEPVYQTALGEQRSILLQDGSLVELNTQSRLEVRYSPVERLIKLQAGEAVFDVAKDPQRPFRVLAGAAEVVAIGTRFNIYHQIDQTIVTVVEGTIAVNGLEKEAGTRGDPGQSVPKSISAPSPDKLSEAISGQAIRLTDGEQIAVLASGALQQRITANPKVVTAWTERRLVFDGDVLATAVREINRYNQKKLELGDEELGRLQISGVFSANNPEAMVAFLKTVGGVRVERKGQAWILYPQKPPAGPRESSGGSVLDESS